MKEVKPLPPTSDQEVWGGESYISENKDLKICKVHNKNEWMKGEYIDNKDQTITCGKCGWGCFLPGYYRVLFGKIIDLRDFKGDKPL